MFRHSLQTMDSMIFTFSTKMIDLIHLWIIVVVHLISIPFDISPHRRRSKFITKPIRCDLFFFFFPLCVGIFVATFAFAFALLNTKCLCRIESDAKRNRVKKKKNRVSELVTPHTCFDLPTQFHFHESASFTQTRIALDNCCEANLLLLR